MHVQLADTTNTLLREIADKSITRDSVALTYAFAICSKGDTHWSRINDRIVERWSYNALRYIKRKAWKLIHDKEQELKGQQHEQH